MSDDEATRRILSSGKEESDRRAARGFPPGPADDGDGRSSGYSSESGSSEGSGWGSTIAAIVIMIGVGGYLLTRYVAIPIMATLFAMLFSGKGKRRRR